jgi:transcriptional regulator with XRE-family HTH domain
MDDRIYRVFGARLRELREEKSVTQDELARRVDLSRTSITNIEKGRQRVMLHQMVDLARALEADPQTLLPAADSLASPPLRPDVKEVVEALRHERDRKS